MCLEVRKTCECGARNAQFNLRDNVMLPEVISGLYCPTCSGEADFDEANMLRDNGWVIAYDMELARAIGCTKLCRSTDEVTPSFLFDEGYATWLEIYPGEKDDFREEKDEIVQLQKRDPKGYLQTIMRWNIDRMAKLKADGWRRAQSA